MSDPALIDAIKANTESLIWQEDDIALDRALGELEGLIYTARQDIADEWRCARDIVLPKGWNAKAPDPSFALSLGLLKPKTPLLRRV